MAGISSIIKKYILAPFGSGNSQVRNNEIPLNLTTVPNQMSWRDGIPTVTTQPIQEDGTGGIPARAGDVGGVFNVLSNEVYNLKLGISPQEYDTRINTAPFNGYPKGAIVWYQSDINNPATKKMYQSLLDNNTTVPTNRDFWIEKYQSNTVGFMPDWTRGTPLPFDYNIDKIATTNGWLQIKLQATIYSLNLLVNGYTVVSVAAYGGGDNVTTAGLVPIKKGDVYRLYREGGDPVLEFNFFPLISE